MRLTRIAVIVLLSILLLSSIACGTQSYHLYTSVSGQGTLSTSSGTYKDGELVTIAAIPASGWKFDHWGGSITGTENPIYMRMHSDKNIEAYFTEIQIPTPTPTSTFETTPTPTLGPTFAPTPTSTSIPTGIPTPTPTPSPTPTITPISTSTPTSTPAAGYSRSNPAPIGTAIHTDFELIADTFVADITVTEIVRGETAWNMIEAADMSNGPAPSGYEYILAKIRFHYISSSPSQEYDWFYFQLVSSGGVTQDIPFVVPPDPQLNSVYPGATTEGWEAFLVEADDPAPLLKFGTGSSSTSTTWFKLYN